jgi:putative zinc finger protein
VDCEVFQSELPDLVYGELPDERRAQAEAHAEGCPSCAAIYAEVRGVKGSLPPPLPPPQLGARIKLMARDQLLEEKAPAPDRTGGPIHLAIVTILGACLVAFGLGVTFERQRRGEGTPKPSLSPEDLTFPSQPPRPSATPARPVATALPPQARPAWQARLYEAGQERLGSERWEDAEAFFRRAASVLPEGDLAGFARAGAAEALIRQDQKAAARAELDLLRREARAGRVPGGAELLQRIAELSQAAGD